MYIKQLSDVERRVRSIFPRVLGVDEVNVCSYFGEVVVVGVVIPQDESLIIPVRDSKELTDTQISKIANQLMSTIEYYVEYVTPRECDKQLLQGEYRAIKRICKRAKPDFVFIDYHSIPDKFHIPQWGFQNADKELWSVSAASIIAKYIWNKKCEEYHKMYPEYNLISNRGSFGNQLFNLTVKHGLTKYHRVEWIKSACQKKRVDFSSIKVR